MDLIFKKTSFGDFFNKWFEKTKNSDNFEESVGFYDWEEEKFKEEFKETYCLENDITELDEANPKYVKKYEMAKDKRIKDLAHDWYFDRLADFTYELEKKCEITDSGVICVRSIMVDDYDEFFLNLVNGFYNDGFNGIGVCWSWDHIKAAAHWGKGNFEVKIKALIPFSAIDKNLTFFLNMNPTLGEDEAEIRLIENRSVYVISINDEDLPNPIKLKS